MNRPESADPRRRCDVLGIRWFSWPLKRKNPHRAGLWVGFADANPSIGDGMYRL